MQSPLVLSCMLLLVHFITSLSIFCSSYCCTLLLLETICCTGLCFDFVKAASNKPHLFSWSYHYSPRLFKNSASTRSPLRTSRLPLTDDSSYYLLDNKLHRLAMGPDRGAAIGLWVCVFACAYLLQFGCFCLDLMTTLLLCVQLFMFAWLCLPALMDFSPAACAHVSVCLSV